MLIFLTNAHHSPAKTFTPHRVCLLVLLEFLRSAKVFRTLFQYPVRRLIVKNREVSKLLDWWANVSVEFQSDTIIWTTNLVASRSGGQVCPSS